MVGKGGHKARVHHPEGISHALHQISPELQKRKKLAPTNFLTQKISTKTRDLRHFEIRDKIA